MFILKIEYVEWARNIAPKFRIFLSVSNNVKLKLSFYLFTRKSLHRFSPFPDNLSREKFGYFFEVFRQIPIIPRLGKLKKEKEIIPWNISFTDPTLVILFEILDKF